MSKILYTSLRRLFNVARKTPSFSNDMPNSAKRAIERSSQPRPFTINRETHGTRPWHSYKSSQNGK